MAAAPAANPRLGPFFLLWTGQTLSLLGSQAVQFALIWWLAARTGSAATLVAATLAGILPFALCGPWAGALADRWNRKLLLVLADGAVALVSLALALAFVTGGAAPGAVLGALLLRGVAGAFHGPAMLAATSQMVPAEQLARIQGLNQSVQGGMLIVSAPLGALLVAQLPMAWVLAVDVATALMAILPLAFVAVPGPGPRADGAARSSTWDDLRAGVRYVATRPGHRSLLALSAAINVCVVPAYALLPLLIQGPLGGEAGALGAAQSAFGLGTIGGGILLGAWGGTRRRIVTALAAIAGIGLATLALGLAPDGASRAAALVMVLVGAFASLANGPIVAVLQAIVPAEFQGRVFGLYGSLATLATPIGLVLAAPLAELAGVRAWYVAGGLACAGLAVAGALTRSILHIEDEAQLAPLVGVP